MQGIRATVLASLMVFVLAAPAQSGSAGGDHASGGGRTGSQGDTVHVGARSGAFGENPSGSFGLHTSEGLRFTARVTCLTVVGDSARIGGEIISSSDTGGNYAEGRGVFYNIKDNGNRAPDQASDFEPLPAPPTACPPPSVGGFVLAEFVVEDNAS